MCVCVCVFVGTLVRVCVVLLNGTAAAARVDTLHPAPDTAPLLRKSRNPRDVGILLYAHHTIFRQKCFVPKYQRLL